MDDLKEVVEILKETANTQAKSQEDEKRRAQNPNRIARSILAHHKLIYTAGNFYSYAQGLWSPLEEEEVRQIIMAELKDDYRKSKASEITEILENLTFIKNTAINNVHNLVNLSNGVLNINTGEILPHSPQHYFTIQIKAKYEPSAECPKWLNFLNQMLGDDPAKIQVLQEYFGYSLDYKWNLEVLLFMIGRGANGKSVVADVFKSVIGGINYTTISLDDMRKPAYLAMLFGKMANISTESESKGYIYESVLKRLASGEEITVDEKYKAPFHFKPTCKQIMSMNNLPRVGDRTRAFFRRVIPLPFNMEVKREDIVFKLGESLAQEEAPGILNWMIEGLKRIKAQKGRFTESHQVMELLEDYKKQNNSALVFVDEECSLGEGEIIEIKVLYEAYKKYCSESGLQALGKQNFTSEIISNFKSVSRGKGTHGVRNLYGISLQNRAPF